MAEGKSQISSDNLTLYRVVAMVMVVLYHCTCYYAHPHWPFGEGPFNPLLKMITTLMGGVHMPVFVFISGYLYWMLKRDGHYDNLIIFYKNKILRLLVPYFVVGIGLIMIFDNFYTGETLLYGICHLWFLLMLFGLFVMAPGLWMLFEKIKSDRIVTVLMASSFVLYPIFNRISFLTISKIFYFLPFFLVGYLIQRRGKKKLFSDWIFWTSLILFFVILFIITPRSLFMDKIIRMYASFLVIIVVSLVPNVFLIPKFKKLLTNISYNSMGIYLIHQIIIGYTIMVPSIKIKVDSIHSFLGVLLLFIFVFFVSWMLSILFNCFRISRFLIGGKFNR